MPAVRQAPSRPPSGGGQSGMADSEAISLHEFQQRRKASPSWRLLAPMRGACDCVSVSQSPSFAVGFAEGRSHPMLNFSNCSNWKNSGLLEPSRTTYQNRVSPSRALRGGSENVWVRYPASKTRRAINLRRCRPVEDPALDGTVCSSSLDEFSSLPHEPIYRQKRL